MAGREALPAGRARRAAGSAAPVAEAAAGAEGHPAPVPERSDPRCLPAAGAGVSEPPESRRARPGQESRQRGGGAAALGTPDGRAEGAERSGTGGQRAALGAALGAGDGEKRGAKWLQRGRLGTAALIPARRGRKGLRARALHCTGHLQPHPAGSCHLELCARVTSSLQLPSQFCSQRPRGTVAKTLGKLRREQSLLQGELQRASLGDYFPPGNARSERTCSSERNQVSLISNELRSGVTAKAGLQKPTQGISPPQQGLPHVSCCARMGFIGVRGAGV
ncbi:uncharacterized protein LOC119706678 [Motacilla alba alba]|uniref:uncharacterized protein LOC119706678 n=1 Tax=Motacilla alba alba TaxID=1094192 RepID=UPI0018D4E5FD|nr:uncharacterized protein LOC119706678 [Motacilla alba alba]